MRAPWFYRLRRRDRKTRSGGMEPSERSGLRPYPRMPSQQIPHRQVATDAAESELIRTIVALIERLDKQQAQFETNQGGVEGPVWQTIIPGLLIPIQGGGGSLTDQVYLKPPPECCMSIRRLTVSGFTAGSVTAFVNNDDPALPFPVAASNFFNRGALLLDSGEFLNLVASGVTGQPVVFGRIDTFPAWYLSEYLS